VDDRLAKPERAVLALLGVALVAVGIALSAQQAVAVVLILGGLVLVLVALNGTRLDEVSLARGGARWRKQVVEEAQRQTRETIEIRPEPVVLKTQVPEPKVESIDLEGSIRPTGNLETKVIPATTADTVKTTDEVTATVLRPADYQQEAVFVRSPDGFARLILEAVEAERARLGAEEYWAEGRHVGTDDNDYHLTLDLRGLTADQSRRLADQAKRFENSTYQVSATVAETLAAIADVAMRRAESLPFGGPPNVIVISVGVDGLAASVAEDKEQLGSLARGFADDTDELVAYVWRRIADEMTRT
jgi:hypothetical protein